MTAFTDTIEKILDQIAVLEAKLDKNKKALEALQGVCEHDWKLDYVSGHNGDEYYKCAKCRLGPTKFPDAYP